MCFSKMNNELNNDEAIFKDDEAFDILNVGHFKTRELSLRNYVYDLWEENQMISLQRSKSFTRIKATLPSKKVSVVSS